LISFEHQVITVHNYPAFNYNWGQSNIHVLILKYLFLKINLGL